MQEPKTTKIKQLNDITMKKEFTSVRAIKDIVIFTSLIIAGSILIALPTGTGINITGFFLIFAGIILALVLRTGYKDVETGERYLKKELYFQQAMQADIQKALKSDPASIDLSEQDKGNALKLDIHYSKAKGKAYVQLYEYIPYNYQPCSSIYEHDINKISNMIK